MPKVFKVTVYQEGFTDYLVSANNEEEAESLFGTNGGKRVGDTEVIEQFVSKIEESQEEIPV